MKSNDVMNETQEYLWLQPSSNSNLKKKKIVSSCIVYENLQC